jgi:predicted enzyme related to lactoylglutathione lyase
MGAEGDSTMGQPVVHFEVMGNDAAALRSFYSDLFGWKINVDENLQYGMIDPADNPPGGSESSGIGGGIGEMPEGQPGYATFYVDVPDVEASLAQAEKLGGTRVMGPETVMEGLVIGLFTDPEGHLIGVAASGA